MFHHEPQLPHRSAPPGRLVFGVFTGFERLLEWTRAELDAAFGPLDAALESPVFPFPETRTYARTMGSGLVRQFFVRETPWPQDGLAAVKRRTLELEARAVELERWPVARPLNVDPGIVNDCRLILASTKDYSHRIYRGDGIWEEITLVYSGGEFRPLEWTYPDFRREETRAYLARVRARHLEWLREGKPR